MSKETESGAMRILRVDHPLLKELKKILCVEYNFYIEGKDDLGALLKANDYKFNDIENCWICETPECKLTLSISDSLFQNGELIYIKHSDWKSEYLKFDRVEYNIIQNFDSNDLLF